MTQQNVLRVKFSLVSKYSSARFHAKQLSDTYRNMSVQVITYIWKTVMITDRPRNTEIPRNWNTNEKETVHPWKVLLGHFYTKG